MRLIFYTLILSLALSPLGCGPSRDNQDAARKREEQDRKSAAFKAGEATHELSREAGKAAREAGRELRKEAGEAREGRKAAGREERAKQKKTEQ